jgi:hypothetical protein
VSGDALTGHIVPFTLIFRSLAIPPSRCDEDHATARPVNAELAQRTPATSACSPAW